jgi:hypothetical protein
VNHNIFLFYSDYHLDRNKTLLGEVSDLNNTSSDFQAMVNFSMKTNVGVDSQVHEPKASESCMAEVWRWVSSS